MLSRTRAQVHKECSRCSELEEQVEILKQSLRASHTQPQQQQQPQQKSNQEYDDSGDLETTVIRNEKDRDEESNENSALSLVSPTIVSPSQHGEQGISMPLVPSKLFTEKSEMPESAATSDPVHWSAASSSSQNAPLNPQPRNPKEPKEPQDGTSDQPHSQQHTLPSFGSFIGYEDDSLGDLFKYAVVIAGPAPLPSTASSAQQSPQVHPRKMFADFRRTRSLPEGQQQQQQRYGIAARAIPEEGPISESSSKLRLLPASRPGRFTPRQPQTLLEFISEEQPAAVAASSSPASQRKSGWLSNLVAQRFRGTSSLAQDPVMTTVEAPARLTTVPSEFDTEEHAIPATIESSIPVSQASKMLCVYPPQTKEVAELEGLVELCFPYGDRMPPASDFTVANLKRALQERHRTYRSSDSTFVLTIASPSNPCEITYAICVICPLFSEEEAVSEQQHQLSNAEGEEWSPEPRRSSRTSYPRQCCLCLLSPYPFFGLFFKVLFGVAVLWESKRRDFGERYALALRQKHDELPRPLQLSDFIHHFHTILANLKHMRIPSMGGWSRMCLAPEFTQLAFHRPHSESITMERRVLLLEYAAPTLFALLSVDQVLFLLGCLCCEHKVLVVSDHVNVVSSCVLALITLLSPLQWAGPVITVLPPRLDELLEAPVPLIAGRVSIASASIPRFSTLPSPMKGVIEVNMDQNNLCMHDEDLSKYHELKLPGCDALVHELKYFSSQLFEKYTIDSDFPSVQQTEASEIICTRIHRHLKFICSLALSHNDDERPAGASSWVDTATQKPVATDVDQEQTSESVRRCSDLTLDYIQRFKETQMFSMFKSSKQQQHRDDEDEHFTFTAHNEDDDDDGDDWSDDDDIDTLNTDSCDTEQFFTDESISYEPDALCSK